LQIDAILWGMRTLLIIIGALILYFFAYKQWAKASLELAEKNKNINSTPKRGWNAFSTMIWPGYLYVLATGIWLNNFFLR
jgi:hypothetical protein